MIPRGSGFSCRRHERNERGGLASDWHGWGKERITDVLCRFDSSPDHLLCREKWTTSNNERPPATVCEMMFCAKFSNLCPLETYPRQPMGSRRLHHEITDVE